MIKEYIAKIGWLTIKIKEEIIDKKNSHHVHEDSTIKKRSMETFLNNRKESKTHIDNKILILPIIIILSIFSKNMLMIESTSIIIITILLYKYYPTIKEKQKQEEVIKQLPYALRQLSIELQAGIGLFDAMDNISNSDYGPLSEEFKITLEEIHYGTNYNQAFNNLSKRNNQRIMKKTIGQIIRTLNNGGNLSKTLTQLANEHNYNMKIKYKEYSEKLNSFMLLYMFIAVLIPVILFIMIIAATTVIGPIIQPELLLILYLFFFPLVVSFMILIIKKMEPV